MSHLIVLAADDAGSLSRMALVLSIGWSLGLAGLAGVFQPGRILGPRRLEPGESLRNLLSVTALAPAAWAATLFVFGGLIGAAHDKAAGAMVLTDAQKVLLYTLIDAAVIAAIVLGTLTLRPAAFVSPDIKAPAPGEPIGTLDYAAPSRASGGLQYMGLGLANIPSAIFGGLIAILIILPLVFPIESITESLWNRLHMDHATAHDLLLILQDNHNVWMHVGIFVSAIVLAPVAEEMFFRGCVQTLLRYWLGHPWPAVLITALLFAAVHPWWMMPPIFFLALGLGYVYERTGNLWMSIVTHSLFNLVSIIVFWYFQM